jgi:hypothetical protein
MIVINLHYSHPGRVGSWFVDDRPQTLFVIVDVRSYGGYNVSELEVEEYCKGISPSPISVILTLISSSKNKVPPASSNLRWMSATLSDKLARYSSAAMKANTLVAQNLRILKSTHNHRGSVVHTKKTGS